MKKFSLVILFLVSWQIQFSQTFNYAYHFGSEITFNIVGINSKCFYLDQSTAVPSCCRDQINLVGIDSGKEIFRTPLASNPFMKFGRVAVTAEKNLIVYGGTIIKGCDYGGAEFEVAKIDTTGAIKWRLTFNKKIDQLLTLPDGSFFLLANNILENYSSSGAFTFSISPGLSINNIVSLNSGNILINYNSGSVPRFRIINSAGIMISDLNAAAVLKDMTVASNNDVLGISGNNLQKYSPSLTLKYSTANSLQSSQVITSFVCRNDSVFAVGQTNIGAPFYMILDSSLNIIHQSSTNIGNSKCTGIYLSNNNSIHIIMYSSTSLTPSHHFTSYFQLPVNGNINAGSDIGVCGIEILDLTYENYQYFGANMFHGTVNAKVTVRNYGIDTIRSFHLNHYVAHGGLFFCLVGLNNLYNVTIAPGDSVSVTTGTFNTSRYNINNLDEEQSIPYSLCIYTSVPDETNDIQLSNDFTCDPVKLVPVGLIENSEWNSDLQIFPNPSSSGITVQAMTVLTTIEIFDLTGKMIKNLVVNKNEFYLENKTLPAGLYVFKINTGKGVLRKKVVIE
jgi:hypothetical protein